MRPAPTLCALAVAAAAVALAASSARAQSCGGCTSPPVPGGGAQRSWLSEGGWSARLSGEFDVKDTTYRGRDRVINDFDETLRIWRTDLAIRHGLTDRWTVGLDLSNMRYHYRLKPPGGQRVRIVERGPGDTVLRVGRMFDLGEGDADGGPAPAEDAADDLAFFERLTLGRPIAARPIAAPTLSAWASLSVPTGDVARPNPAIVRRDFSVSNLQTGTGTWDPGLSLRLDVPRDGWRAFAVATAVHPFRENEYEYRTGSTLSLSAGVERDLVPGLRGSVTASFVRTGNDRFEGDGVAVGGGDYVYVTPGLSWDLSERVSVDAGVRWTAHRNAESKVVDSNLAFTVGIVVRF